MTLGVEAGLGGSQDQEMERKSKVWNPVEFATDYRTHFFRGLTIIDVTAHKDVPVVPILIGVLDPFHQVPTPGIGDEVERNASCG